MRIPRLNPLKNRRQVVSAFKGYDKRAVIDDGAWRDTQNVTLDDYPTLKVRGKRGTVLTNPVPPAVPTTIAPTEIVKVNNQLCYIEGNKIHVGSSEYTYTGLSPTSEHSIVVFGAYLIILPEKIYFNTADTTDKGSIESDVQTIGDITLSPCDEAGDTTAEVKNHIKVENDQITETAFAVGDGVEIFLLTGTAEAPEGFEGTHIITAIGSGYLVYKGDLEEATTITGTFKYEILRWFPVLDVLFECGNRLWGAHWGEDIHGNHVNEIYASALGDFRNWRIYEGAISTNSYTASVGKGGKFTGGCAYQGNPTFFKEDVMYRVYGSYPAQYQIQETACSGVIDDGYWSEGQTGRSMAIVNNVLYYKSRAGVCAYDGSLPVEIGGVFGKEKYHDAVGGAFKEKYYLSMADENDVYHLFVYDTSKGQWIREDNTRVRRFVEVGDEMYFIRYDGTNRKLMTVNGTGQKEDDQIEWYAVTGDLGLTYSVDKKYVERLTIRAKLGIGSYMGIEISYDDGEWKNVSRIAGWNLKSFSIPVPVRRCDHFRLRLSGRGDAQIYSIAKTEQEGSEK